MLRTGIYVSGLSIVTIRAHRASAWAPQLFRYHESTARPAIGTHTLERGIYLILSEQEIEAEIKTESQSLVLQTLINDKDPWPSPNAQVVALEEGADAGAIERFFTRGRDI